MIGISILQRPELVVMATSFFLLEAVILALLALGLARVKSKAAGPLISE